MNYRGVGQSAGLPWTFEELVLDGEAVMDAVIAQVTIGREHAPCIYVYKRWW